jgi:hypothetical protein
VQIPGKDVTPFPNIQDTSVTRNPYHLVAIGTQECQRYDKSVVSFSPNGSFNEKWERRLLEIVGDNYTPLLTNTLGCMHLAIYAHESVSQFVQAIDTDKVATGVGGVLGNKGAIAVGLEVLNTSFAFVNCHFAGL